MDEVTMPRLDFLRIQALLQASAELIQASLDDNNVKRLFQIETINEIALEKLTEFEI